MKTKATSAFAVFAALMMVAVPLAVVGNSIDVSADAEETDVRLPTIWTINAYYSINQGVLSDKKITSAEILNSLTPLSPAEMMDRTFYLTCNSSNAWTVFDDDATVFDGSGWGNVIINKSLANKEGIFKLQDGVVLTLGDMTIWRCDAAGPIIKNVSSDGTGSLILKGEVIIGNPDAWSDYTVIDVDTVDIYGDAVVYGTIDANVVLHDGASLKGNVNVAGDITVENGADVTFGSTVSTTGAFITGGDTGYENVEGLIRVESSSAAEYSDLKAEYDAVILRIGTLEDEKNDLAKQILGKNNTIKQLQDRIEELEDVEDKLVAAKANVESLEAELKDAVEATKADGVTIESLKGQLETAKKLASDNENLYKASVEAAKALQVKYDEAVDDLETSEFKLYLTSGALEYMNGHCEELYQKNQAYIAQIEGLQTRISTLETTLSETTDELDFLKIMYDAMKDERNSLKDANESYVASIAELKTNITKTKALLKESEGTASLYMALQDASMKEIARLTAENEATVASLAEVEEDLDKVEAALATKEMDIIFLNEVHAISMKEAERMENEIETLTASNAELASDIIDFESKLKTAEGNYALEQQKNADLNNKVNGLRQDLNDKIAEAEGLTDDLSEANADIATLTGKLTAAEKEQKLTAAELETATADLGKANSRITALESDLSAAKTALSEKEAAIVAAGTRNTNLEHEIDSAQDEIRTLGIDLGNAKSDASALMDQIAGLNQQISDVRADAAKTAEEKDAQIGQLNAQLASAVSAHEAATLEIAGLNGQIAGLNARIATLNTDKSALNEIIAGLQAENLGYLDEVQRLTGELGKANTEGAKLQGMLDDANERIKGLEADLEAEIAKVATLEASAVTAASDIADLRSQVDEKVTEKTVLQAQLEEAGTLYSDAISEMTVVKADLAKALEDLKAEQAKSTASESRNAELEERIAELEAELENVRKTIEDSKKVPDVKLPASDSEAQPSVDGTAVKVTVGSDTVDAVIGQKMIFNADAPRDGFKFDGWYVDGKLVSKDDALSIVVTSDVNVQQSWTAVGSAASDVDDVATGSELEGANIPTGDLIKCLAVLLLVIGGLYVVKRELV